MIPEQIKKNIIIKPIEKLGGQQTNGTPYTGVEIELESVGSIRVNYFRSKSKNLHVAMELMEILLYEANILPLKTYDTQN